MLIKDIDECIESNSPLNTTGDSWVFPCGSSATCINSPGSFECKCRPGFKGDPVTTCLDINECHLEGSCGEHASCLNFPGSYKCFCPKGFKGNGKENCIS